MQFKDVLRHALCLEIMLVFVMMHEFPVVFLRHLVTIVLDPVLHQGLHWAEPPLEVFPKYAGTNEELSQAVANLTATSDIVHSWFFCSTDVFCWF